MDPSSIVRSPSGQRGSGSHRDQALASVRQYRRERQHLYPFDDFEVAFETGRLVTSFCGIEAEMVGGDVVEVNQPEASDCVACVDIWRGHRLVRL